MKGYWIVLGSEIDDQEEQSEYVKLWAPIAERYRAKLKSIDFGTVLVECKSTTRIVAVEFPSYEQAKACYADPAYVEAKTHALKASTREFLILEGDIA
ncbi:DUF1330 domain-containing protein [Caballeronia sp. 15715]|uniref:DUF1330 domain-containing protein n=1 Tax=Caballeronia sp. 15715 TaxID=3391030 RepID=UPI0039E58B4B